jgi:hypothetical protein
LVAKGNNYAIENCHLPNYILMRKELRIYTSFSQYDVKNVDEGKKKMFSIQR